MSEKNTEKMDFKAMWAQVKADIMRLEKEMYRAGIDAPERPGFLSVIRMMNRAEEAEFNRVYNGPSFDYW